jgi:hypothetical protein
VSATNIRQQIIVDEVDGVATRFGISEDVAFLRFAHHLLTGRSLYAFDDDDLVDGGQDKQIDTVTIEADDSAADVWSLGRNSKLWITNLSRTRSSSSGA